MIFHKKTFLMKFILGILIFSQVAVPLVARAVGTIPFGGIVTGVIPCLCSGNFLIIQKPVAGPAMLMYQPGVSRLYQYGQILVPGTQILGNASVPVPCVELIVIFCVPIYTAPLITMVGTSGIAGAIPNFGGPNGSANPNSSGAPPGPNTPSPTGSTTNNPCSTNQSQSSAGYITANEGWRNNVYVDSRGNPTVGIGHLIRAGESIPSGYLTDTQVRNYFNQDYSRAVNDARGAADRHNVDFDSLSPARQTVLVDMAFNMGTNPNGLTQGQQGLDGFNRMWSGIEAGDWQRAGQEVQGSGYYGPRADRNAQIMATDDQSLINQQINRDPRSASICPI
ncbi:MAG: hypothetical protein COX02_02525 [Candidatus Vogelbacteria bacterium CG22_combo_CG10-13_8_21_14_all_37_9]|uniref:Lysozyme n=1 Tax=Candidatus Vogelbacteria bacterium CG22_combo_CG10-13_8_21_14_all_37_9 TaxID=1975046 RepID=A0A2H0BJZ4_9BACT|nr:MAG: hypothetical protein BK005_01655 [bacterium CG10_37_50]PIP58003.1 MAG: hypothetical protein COX02_02525 [Candidatus Vogelbacteria bacterium CG22_combo_CG10-13_8_21_14_all_37_9]